MKITMLVIAIVAFTSIALAGGKPASFGLKQHARSLTAPLEQRLTHSWATARAALGKTGATIGVLAVLCSAPGCEDKRVWKNDINVGTHVLYYNQNLDDGNKLHVGEVELVFQALREYVTRFESTGPSKRKFVVENEEDGTHVVVGIDSVVDFATHNPDLYAFLAWDWQDVFSSDGDIVDRKGIVEGKARKVFEESGYYQISPYSLGGSYLIHRRDVIILKEGNHIYTPPSQPKTVSIGLRVIKITGNEGRAAIEYASVSDYLALREQLPPDFYVGLSIHYREDGLDYFGNVIKTDPDNDGLRLEDGHSEEGSFILFEQLQGVAVANHPLYTQARFSDVRFLTKHASRNVGESPLATFPPHGDSNGYVRGKLVHVYTSGVASVGAWTMKDLRDKNFLPNYYVVDSENLESVSSASINR